VLLFCTTFWCAGSCQRADLDKVNHIFFIENSMAYVNFVAKMQQTFRNATTILLEALCEAHRFGSNATKGDSHGTDTLFERSDDLRRVCVSWRGRRGIDPVTASLSNLQ
jgi:hypothetical protein